MTKIAMSPVALTRLGSNQDSSEPKSDVLPVTPRVNWDAKIKIILHPVGLEANVKRKDC